jgi:hypothetical protein
MTAHAPVRLAVKVTVADTWQSLHLVVPGDETVAALKARALSAYAVDPDRAPLYEVKFGGAQVRDESRTLQELGVPDGAALVVLARRRRAVR